MVHEGELRLIHRNGSSCVLQNLDRIPFFEVVLASMRVCRLTRELPARCGIIDERIAKNLSRFMRQRCNVLESSSKYPRRDPAGVLRDPTILRNRRRVKEIGVETENAAPARHVRVVYVQI